MNTNSKASYDFHDPTFVRWWLESHYLLPVNDQIAIAMTVRERVAVPAVHDEIDDFLAERVHEEEPDVLEPLPREVGTGQHGSAGDTSRSQGAWDVVVSSVRRLWDEQRSLVLLFIVIVGIFVARGLMAVAHLARQAIS